MEITTNAQRAAYTLARVIHDDDELAIECAVEDVRRIEEIIEDVVDLNTVADCHKLDFCVVERLAGKLLADTITECGDAPVFGRVYWNMHAELVAKVIEEQAARRWGRFLSASVCEQSGDLLVRLNKTPLQETRRAVWRTLGDVRDIVQRAGWAAQVDDDPRLRSAASALENVAAALGVEGDDRLRQTEP